MLCYCDFSVAGKLYEAWSLWRIPNTSEAVILEAQCDCLNLISHRIKAKGLTIGSEVWFVFRVLSKNDVELPNILAHVPAIPENERFSLKIHHKEA